MKKLKKFNGYCDTDSVREFKGCCDTDSVYRDTSKFKEMINNNYGLNNKRNKRCLI